MSPDSPPRLAAIAENSSSAASRSSAISAAMTSVAHGQGRGRYYTGSDSLKALATGIRSRRSGRDDTDPFA